MTKLFIPRERRAHESRVAAIPETVKKLAAAGFEVTLEAGAGTAAGFSDADYETVGARTATDPTEAWAPADAVLCVAPPEPDEISA
ncbi:MAG: NAD(P)(+) transhydrogenase (Re/Si-specific) subunit alpha, partial [Thermoanaerobaculia bacterium]